MLFQLHLNRKLKQPLYEQLEEGIKSLVFSGELEPGAKLPSIRTLSHSFSISKTTIELAYQTLIAEGYVVSKPKKGYYISTSNFDNQNKLNIIETLKNNDLESNEEKETCDFSNYNIDPSYFDKQYWKRHINYILRNSQVLSEYGESQGSYELRKSIAKYSIQSRGVYAHPNQIVIGAGIQSLLHILIPLLPKTHQKIHFQEPVFKAGEKIFKDHHYDCDVYKTINDITLNNTLYYIRPSDLYWKNTDSRLNFIKATHEKNIILIEDDYNGEFRYDKKPIPALRSLDQLDEIIYLGSFSGLLSPSIRISYLILPNSYLQHLEKAMLYHTQTCSTLEQLALSSYINQGFLDKQIRKMKKGYERKKHLLTQVLKKAFGDRVQFLPHHSGVEILVSFDIKKPNLYEKARFNQVHLKQTKRPNQFIFVYSGIEENQIHMGIQKLKEAWLSN